MENGKVLYLTVQVFHYIHILMTMHACLYYTQFLAVTYCGHPPSIRNGHATYFSTNFTSIATYTCQKGYDQNGEVNTIECQANSEWTNPSISCEGKLSMTNKGLYVPMSLPIEVIVTRVKVLHTLISLYLLRSVFFSPTPEIDCGKPPSIPRAKPVYNSTFFLSKVSYICQPGYVLSKENPALVCLSNKQWFGGVPHCEGKV